MEVLEINFFEDPEDDGDEPDDFEPDYGDEWDDYDTDEDD